MAKPSVVGHLQTRLKTVLADSSIILGELELDTGNYGFVNGTGAKPFIDEENGHRGMLYPLIIPSSPKYWLSLILSYNLDEGQTKHVSITIFNNLEIKLFRADWSDNQKGGIPHGQPHWHFHPSPNKLLREKWEPEEIEVFSNEIKNDNNENIIHLHFAMSALWNRKEMHIESLAKSEDSNIVNWVEGVIRYVSMQLQYLWDKSHVV